MNLSLVLVHAIAHHNSVIPRRSKRKDRSLIAVFWLIVGSDVSVLLVILLPGTQIGLTEAITCIRIAISHGLCLQSLCN